MTVRTTSATITFTHPFNLSGTDEVQPPGTYTIETNEELLQTSLVPAYRRISTLMRLPARSTGAALTQMVPTDPAELAAIMAGDAVRCIPIRQPMHVETVAPRHDRVSRTEFIRRGWAQRRTLNANSLVWQH
jgi:hypothetical protein